MGRSETNLPRGALLLIAGFMIIPLMDGAAKSLMQLGYAPILVAWTRFAVSTLFLAPVILAKGGLGALLRAGAVLQLIRAVMLAVATALFFGALETMPLADALAIYFVYPFWITLLAPLLLGERVGMRRLSAVAVGFAGSLLIIRPGFDGMPDGVGLLIVASLAFAIYNILTRRLSGRAGAWQTLFYQSLVGTLFLGVMVPGVWQTPDATALGWAATIGTAAIAGHWLLIRAFDYAPASLLAPFGYFEMVSAVLIGFVLFGDFPDPMTWAGIAVIVATGVYISVRERRRSGSGALSQ